MIGSRIARNKTQLPLLFSNKRLSRYCNRWYFPEYKMLSRDELPEDPQEWADITVDLPRLTPDTPDSCPMPMSELLEYVDMESSEPGTANQSSLKFLRTANTDGTRCWIWGYTESDGEVCYLTYRELPNGSNTRGMSSASPAYNGEFKLTPEQYLLAEHYDLVYW